LPENVPISQSLHTRSEEVVDAEATNRPAAHDVTAMQMLLPGVF
jgi:hypothetical protein